MGKRAYFSKMFQNETLFKRKKLALVQILAVFFLLSLFLVFQSCAQRLTEETLSLQDSRSLDFSQGKFPVDVSFDSFLFTSCDQEVKGQGNKANYKLAALRSGSGLRINPKFVEEFSFKSSERRAKILKHQFLNRMKPFELEFSLRPQSDLTHLIGFEGALPPLDYFPSTGGVSLNSNNVIKELIPLEPEQRKRSFPDLNAKTNLELSLYIPGLSIVSIDANVQNQIGRESLLIVSYKSEEEDEGVHVFPKEQLDSTSAFGKAYSVNASDNLRYVQSLTEYTSSSLEKSVNNLVEENEWTCETFSIMRPQDKTDCIEAGKVAITEEEARRTLDETTLRFFLAARELFDPERRGEREYDFNMSAKCVTPISDTKKVSSCYRKESLMRGEDDDNNNNNNKNDDKNKINYDIGCEEGFCGHLMSVCLKN